MHACTDIEKQVLTQLQYGVALVPRPFQGFGLPEHEVIALLHRLRDHGLIRRFGGVFDARQLGYHSVLCALDASDAELVHKASIIAAHPGVTHCYERRSRHGSGTYPTLWFTFTMPRECFDAELSILHSQLGLRHGSVPDPALHVLPAQRRFKIAVVFDLHDTPRETAPRECDPGIEAPEPIRHLTETEKTLVRELDQQIPVVTQPFAAIARRIGESEASVLETLRHWQRTGSLRRIGAILYHRKAGFNANAMCAWPMESDVVAAGQRLAAHPGVSHCYQRTRTPRVPFDLYAMIHAPDRTSLVGLFEELSSTCTRRPGTMLESVREFKKSSMTYFRPEA